MAGLEVNEDPDFQWRFWRIQRVAWGLGVAALAAALLGLTGSGGALGRAEVHPDGGVLRYDRVGRMYATMRLTLEVNGPSRGPATIRVGRGYLDRVRIENLHPAPLRVEAEAGACVLVYAGSRPTRLRLDVIPECSGPLEGSIAIDDSPPVEFRQFILP